jgi:PKD repeat protein
VTLDHGHRAAWVAALVLVLTLAFAGVAAAQPTADFAPPAAVAHVNQPVSFTGSATPSAGTTITAASWTFGDGAADASGSLGVSHPYAAPGTYSVTLTVTDSGGQSGSASHSVTVAEPQARFSFSPSAPNAGDGVGFDASSSSDAAGPLASYAWDFGDGSSGSGVKPTHAYATGGDKAVTLTVTAADGHTASVSHTLHVNAPPTAVLLFAAVIQQPTGQDPFTPLIGQNVAFSAQGSSDPESPKSALTFAWDPGTGTFGAASATDHLLTSFPVAGTQTVRLRVADPQGATGTAQVAFRVDTPPVAAFTFAPTTPAPNALVTFTSGSTDADGDLTTLQWDLNGDGRFDDGTGAAVTAVYQTPGDYTVGLQATDSGRATATAFRTVSVAGPPAPPPPMTGGPGDPVVVPSPGAAPLTSAPAATDPGGSGSGGVPGTAAGGRSAPKLKAVPGVRVQIAGSVTGALTRITRLLVVAPRGASVVARCRGTGCPKKAVRRRVTSTGRLRLSTLERRLRVGARIVVWIAQQGYATRQVTLTLRRGSAPARTQSCLYPDQKKPGPCSA